MALVERRDAEGIAELVLNRPERRNALSMALVEELSATLAAAGADPSVRAIVLTGAGASFCAGGDLQDGLQGGGFLAGHEGRGRFAALLAAIRDTRPPVVAAVQGDALGGGCGLAAACDLVVADEAASLGLPEIKLGLFPWIVLAVLQRDVPRKALLEAALTGEKWSAARARELGLVNQVAPAGTCLAVAKALAGKIASRSPAIVGLGKRAFHRVADLGQDDALAFLHAQLTLNLLTEDASEGVAAFVQRREPVWKGR